MLELWVPEGSRGPSKGPRGPFKGPRDPFKGPRGPLELVCGADFSWKLMCGAGPGDLGGSRGRFRQKFQAKPGRKFTARGPLKGPRGPPRHPRGEQVEFDVQSDGRGSWRFSGRFSFGFWPKPTPETRLDCRGPPRTSISTKNQPRRLVLRPFRGTKKNPPDCLQVPRFL